jgi:hypothetical protein
MAGGYFSISLTIHQALPKGLMRLTTAPYHRLAVVRRSIGHGEIPCLRYTIPFIEIDVYGATLDWLPRKPLGSALEKT